jgi:phosphohistidine phosphatase
MRSLLLVRHAKSSWDDPSVPDFDRPLNERGKHDAPMMAKRLLNKKVAIQGFVSSPARRARKTASLFASAYGFQKEDIILEPALYQAEAKTFYEVIAQLPDAAKHIAIFSHNPGITEFVNTLTHVRVDEMPTCAVYAITSEAHSWANFQEASRAFWFFEYPKKQA